MPMHIHFNVMNMPIRTKIHINNNMPMRTVSCKTNTKHIDVLPLHADAHTFQCNEYANTY